MTQLLLTWHPAPDTLVRYRPGSLSEQCALKGEKTHPLKVVKRWTLDGRILGVWVRPTHVPNPIYQSPALMRELVPY